ncbi:hypothetical protein B566_EDAN001133 [Ephemera danica]|nr:hypothetical protein B566_EDAN001133 [Ephemera danica]
MPLDHCKECGSSSLDIDTAKGQVVCTACGEVNESTIVVNDPTYEDNGHGDLMIDFSEQFSVDIYELGRTYIHFTKALHFTLNSIDPCLYIMRFANRLQFGKQTTEVSNTAMRLVQRMKKDHLHVGRRPSGLCGAALLFAARHHGFNRRPSDIVRVVKVHESTLRKRMLEFGETPSSLLSFEDFMSVDLEEEQDPPAYKEARRRDRERREQAKRAKLNLETEGVTEALAEVSELQRQIEEQLQSKAESRKRKMMPANDSLLLGALTAFSDEAGEVRDIQRVIEQSTMSSVVACLHPTDIMPANADVGLEGPTLKMMGLGPPSLAPEPVVLTEAEAQGELDLEGLNDEELDAYILTEEETRAKEIQWLRENADFIKAQQEREAQEAQDRLEGKPEKKKRKTNRKKNAVAPANSAGEAIEKMLKEKKLSQKINYDVLKQLREGSMQTQESCTPPTVSAPVPSPSIRATSSFKTPATVRTPVLPRKVKIEPHIPSVKKEVHVERKPVVVAKPEPPPPPETDEDEDLEDEDEDYEEEEEEQPLSISHLLNEHEQMYGREDYM